MNGLAFLLLTRDAGAAACDLCADVATLARPGDRVVIVDDGGVPDNAAWTGRFVVAQGFGPGVAFERIVTGQRGAGDLGIAANLALSRAAADPAISHALILPGAARLAPPGAGHSDLAAAFRTARAVAEARPAALVAAATGPGLTGDTSLRRRSVPVDAVDRLRRQPGSPAADPAMAPAWWGGPPRPQDLRPGPAGRAAPLSPLGRLILPRRLFAGPGALRAEEGWSAAGLLGLAWRAQSGAGHSGHPTADADDGPVDVPAFALLPKELPDPAWCRAALALLRASGGDQALAGWIWAGLELALSGAIAAEGMSGAAGPQDHGPPPSLAPGAGLALVAPLILLAREAPPPASAGPLARAVLTPDPGAALRAVLRRPPTPGLSGRAPLQVACLGPHARRMPLSYPALAPAWDGQLCMSDPAGADLILFAHPQDLTRLPLATARALSGRTLALLSEEPFWDSLFSPDPLAGAITLPAAHLGPQRLHQVNHHTSAIFAFDRLPYQPLTEQGFAESYARAFARNADLAPDDWQARLAKAPLQAAFMAERRPERFHDMTCPGGDIIGLCAWRTRLAEGYAPPGSPGQVARLGASWQGGPTRFDLPDWHAAKLAQLDGAARLISAIENTHQPTYVSEKLFDAFACGGRPLYVASPGHRVHDLGLPPGAWINLHGLTSTQAPAAIDAQPWDGAFLADYAKAQARLAALWCDKSLIAAERARIGRALVSELARLAELGPAPG